MENYQKLLERIAKVGKVSIEELERKVDAKRAKLSGLISKEGAAQIVAAELGINLEDEKLQLSELVHGMKRVSVVGQVTEVFPVREFKKKDREGKIGSFSLGDETGNMRVVCWDMSHISLIEEGKLKKDDVLEIKNASVRNGELHLSSFSDIRHSSDSMENVKTEQLLSSGNFKDARPGERRKVRAVIVQAFDPKYFKAKDSGENRALLNIVLDDGTDTMRAVLFGQEINKLGFTDEEVFDVSKFQEKKLALLGEEKYFSGSFRTNTYFNRTEFSINGVDEVDPDALIKELEAKI